MAYPYMPTGYHGGMQSAVARIVIHGTVSPTVKGGARAVARYFQSPSTGGSAHYVVDPGEIVQCVKENVVAYHAPPNTNTIGIELCDPQSGSASRWADTGHEAMLRLAARLVREVAARWDVPLKRLSVADLKAGRRGICGHVDVSNAFGQTDHSDPGSGFPWDHFMKLVNGEDDDMDPNTTVKVGSYYKDPVRNQFDKDAYEAGYLWVGSVSETRRYGKAILAELAGQRVTIERLVDAVATGQPVDSEALKATIRNTIAEALKE